MKVQTTNCNNHCAETNCYCKLPLNLFHHVELPCCNSTYHVICILNQTVCPNCKCQFNQDILEYIHHTSIQALQKEKVKDVKKQKRNVYRRYIKKVVFKIIQMRSYQECNIKHK